MDFNKHRGRRVRSMMFLAGVFLSLAPILAHACASCGCTLSSDWENLGISGGSGFKIDIRYDTLDQDQLRSGTGTITPGAASKMLTAAGSEEVERYTNNHYTTLGLDYSNGGNWGVAFQLPYIDRSHSTLGTNSDGALAGPGGGQYDSRTSSVGDLKVIGRYQGLSEQHNLGLLFGFKFATGSHTETGTSIDPTAPGQVPIDRGLQPGTGTTDVILGAYYSNRINASWDYFTQATIQDALDSRDGYRPGRGMNFNAGLRYKGFESVIPLLQLNARYAQHDVGENADTLNTGGKLIYLSPGAVVPITGRVSMYAFIQAPLYQDVRGVQLAPRYTASIGVRAMF